MKFVVENREVAISEETLAAMEATEAYKWLTRAEQKPMAIIERAEFHNDEGWGYIYVTETFIGKTWSTSFRYPERVSVHGFTNDDRVWAIYA